MSIYERETLVIVEPFTRQPAGNEVIIGRLETGVFLAVPTEGVELLEHFALGRTVGEVSDHYRQKYGEVPDLNDFLSFMESKGLVRPKTASTSRNPSPASPKVASRRYHFSNFPQALAEKLFSLPVIAGSLALIAAATVIVFLDLSLAPRPRDLYFPDHRTLCATLLALSGYATIFVHEFGHLVAARSLGINSRIGISHRLWYLVAETDLTGLWSVPRRQRYLPMLAGVLIDLVSASLLVLLLWAHAHHMLAMPVVVLRLVRALGITYLLRVAWQFFFYIRTDFYFVIANFLNCRNLLKDTEVFLRNQLARIFRTILPVDQSAIPAAERRIIRIYSVIWVAGRLLSFFLFFWVTIPVAIRYTVNLTAAFRSGYSANRYNFLDALLLTAYFMVPLMTGLSLWIASFVRRERTR
jgi:putative peptide zinc metalloprotease protein